MKRTALFIGVAILAVLAGPIGAQDEEIIRVHPKEGGWEVEELIQTVSQYCEITILFDPQAPQIARKKIEFAGPAPVEKENLFDWMRAVFFMHRLVLVPVGPEKAKTYSLMDINSPNVVTHPIHVPAENLEEWKDRDGAYIVTTIRLKHLRDTARARNSLAQLATRQVGRVTDSPTTQSFVIGDFAPAVYAMKKLLEDLDRDAAATDPAVRAAADPKINQYEQMLPKCQTVEAVEYFIERIEALRPPK
jgi:type II secretory pathway component GspD/PulD (secretin)